jgi:hypothetical protein
MIINTLQLCIGSPQSLHMYGRSGISRMLCLREREDTPTRLILILRALFRVTQSALPTGLDVVIVSGNKTFERYQGRLTAISRITVPRYNGKYGSKPAAENVWMSVLVDITEVR